MTMTAFYFISTLYYCLAALVYQLLKHKHQQKDRILFLNIGILAGMVLLNLYYVITYYIKEYAQERKLPVDSWDKIVSLAIFISTIVILIIYRWTQRVKKPTHLYYYPVVVLGLAILLTGIFVANLFTT